MTLSPSDPGRPPTYPNAVSSQAPAIPATGDPAQYGRVGVVPWTFAQTIIGASVTLVPWLLVIIGSQLLIPKSQTPTKPLSTSSDISAAIVIFIYSTLIEAVFLLAPAYYAIWRRSPGISARDGLRALGIRGVSWSSAILAFIGGVVTIFVATLVYSLIVTVFHLPLQTNAETLENQARFAPITTFALLAVSVLIAPFCEELFFRGFLFGGLLRGMPALTAIGISGLLFAIAHGDLGSFAVLLVIGLTLAVVRWRVGSIWPSVVLHACNNATAAIAIYVALLSH
jgi:membrane protease YdiL (CAAX protease family)